MVRAPDDIGARFERACVLDRLGRDVDARQAYLDVLSTDMRHAAALNGLAALLIRCGFTSAARTVLGEAVAAHPMDPAAHVSLGHLLRSVGEHTAARVHYQAALHADPAQPEAHQGMSYLLDGVDEASSERHRRLGFADRVLTTQAYRGENPPVVVLKLVSARGGNVLTRHLLDDRTFLTHTLVAEYANGSLNIPPHDIVFNAIGDADRCADALHAAEKLLARIDSPVLNPPGRIWPTTRAGSAQQLGLLTGVIAPRVLTAPRGELFAGPPAGFGFPFLVRSPGFHTGENFLRVEGAADLATALDTLPGETLTVIEPLDARGADGFSRKYRVMMVGGRLLPLHLAISPCWKVHHFTAGMHDRPEHRAEEAAFLADMPGILGEAALAALGRIEEALKLDYGGIDFGLTPQGDVLLFEANATMAVVPPPPGQIWDYRRASVAAVLEQTRALGLATALLSNPECA